MKLKTASLLACIGSAITVMMRTYYFLRYAVVERTEYNTIEGDIHAITEIIAYIFIFVFFIIYYTKQNSKSWKD